VSEPDHESFVLLKCDVERFAQRTMRLNQARHIEYVRFHMPLATSHQPPATNNQ